MWHLIGKTVVLTAVPLLIEAAAYYIKGNVNRAVPITWTRYQYDYVMYMFGWWYQQCKGHPESKVDICAVVSHMNEVMQLDRDLTAYSEIWNGQVSREDLAEGEPYFNYRKLTQ